MLPLGIEEIKPIKITNEGVYFIGKEFRKQIDKKKLSPSMINAINQSPGEWALSTFVEPLVRIEEPIYFARGHWFHSTMEEHFANPNRSINTLKEDFKNVTLGEPFFSQPPKDNPKQYLELSKDIENKKWMTDCINGFIKLNEMENLEDKKIAHIYDKGQTKDGIEFFATANFEGVTNSVLGFVDCIFEEEGGFGIVDWKTGKYHKGDEGYQLQQTLYAMMLESSGFTVSKASLMFPIGLPNKPVVEKIDILNEKVRQEVMDNVKKADNELEKAKNNNYFFPFRRFKWNSWETFLTGNGTAYKPQIHEDKLFQLVDTSEII
jgi:hypothetical protein